MVTGVLHLFHFIRRVVVSFLRNQGLLLASGVGYNALLSIIPLFAVTVVGLSLLFDEQRLMVAIEHELRILVPRHAREIGDAVQGVLESRDVFGVIGFAALLFFSSMAFRMLEEAIAILFHRPPRRRGFWATQLLPYAFIGALAAGLVVLIWLGALLSVLGTSDFTLFGRTWSLAWMSSLSLHLSLLAGEILLIASLYKVLPHVRVRWRNALCGALVATALWEAVSRSLGYYFTYISLVNVVYGSLATVIVVLLTLEFASIIVLLGVQVVVELERSQAAGLPWYQSPEEPVARASTADDTRGPHKRTI